MHRSSLLRGGRRLGPACAALLAFAAPAQSQDALFGNGFESAADGAPLACTGLPGGGTTLAEPVLLRGLEDTGWREAWLGSPTVADLDGDGSAEILAPRHGTLVGWDAAGGVVFNAVTSGRIWSSPVVADFVATSPGLEVAAAAGSSIYLWNAAGTALPGFPVAWRSELRSLAAGDIDGDGDLELVTVTTTRLDAGGQRDILFAVHHDGRPVAGFPPNTSGASGCAGTNCYVTGGYDQNIGLGNVDGDAALEVFATQDNAYLSLHDGNGAAFDAAPIFGTTGKFPGIRFLHDYAQAQQGYANDEDAADQAHFTNSAPVFADVDGDGRDELVVLGSVQNAAQSDRERGVALWALNPDGTRPPQWTAPYHVSGYLAGLWDLGGNIVAATNSVAVGNLDATHAGDEFVFAGFDGAIHAVDSSAGALWSFPYTTDAAVLTSGVALADLTRDGRPEVVFTTYSTDALKSELIVLGADGDLLHTQPLPGRGAMPVPTIADTDGNGSVEIVVSLKDADPALGEVLVYSVPASAPNCMPWPTARGSSLRNGSAGD